MDDPHKPFISNNQFLPEITFKVIFLSLILTVLLAMSNAFLALKIGILASASIPAAIVSMGVLRFIKNSNILQNNLVQTAASAGEAVAGGIVYTAPALILIHYWEHFDYWENFCIALLGGSLGVLFSIPLRRILVTQRQLPFPEGQAIAHVLMVGSKKNFGLSEVIKGGIIGGALEFAQVGIKAIASSFQAWFFSGKTILGIGMGFSPTMIGVGYLVGINIGASMLMGAVLGWIMGIPILSYLEPSLYPSNVPPIEAAFYLWNENIRYVGIGAMLLAGIWSLVFLIKPFLFSMQEAFKALGRLRHESSLVLPRTEQDIPIHYVLLGIIILLFLIFIFFLDTFPFEYLHLGELFNVSLLLGSVLYVLVIGFIFCAITGYFSGLVGVTASPGSAIIIAGLLLAAFVLRMIINTRFYLDTSASMDWMMQSEMGGAVITILLGAIITGAAAIANDNIQDLKVGYILGSTPWKQQLMLLFGVLISAAVIPLVMELLFNVYGIGDVIPHENMNIAHTLPAPPAAMMAAITQGVFKYNLPWEKMGWGAGIISAVILINNYLPSKRRLSILGVAMGIYLPLATSIPLFIGSFLSYKVKKTLNKPSFLKNYNEEQVKFCRQKGILIACGLVAGAALMNIVLAIPFIISGSPDALNILPPQTRPATEVIALAITLWFCIWFYKRVCSNPNESNP